MKLYLAGWESAYCNLPDMYWKLAPKVLTSYFYMQDLDKIKSWYDSGKEIFIDSGAFSAKSCGKSVIKHEYVDFLHKVKNFCELYASLDVIGNPKQSVINYKDFLKEGLNPLPCYHYKEDIRILEYYVSKCDYIGLGGGVGVPQKILRPWLDSVFTKFPNTKFHGFGMTAFPLVKRYPWFSIDSSSWKFGARVGIIEFWDGSRIDFSHKGGIERLLNHPFVNEKLIELFEKYNLPKVDYNELVADYKLRNAIIVLSMLERERLFTENPPKFEQKQMRLFDEFG